MERKSGSSAEVMTVGRRIPHTQTPVVVDPFAPLPRAAGDNLELQDELLLMEMQLLRSMRQRASVTPLPTRAAVGTSPTKSKIVRALRKKR